MGQKASPKDLRLGINTPYLGVWYADKHTYAKTIYEDHIIRTTIFKEVKANIADIVISRMHDKLSVDVYCDKPGMIIGKKGAEIERIKDKLLKTLKRKDLSFNIFEVKKQEICSSLVAKNIAIMLEKRSSFRRVMKRAAQAAMKSGANGIKIRCSGRLAGAEIARSEEIKQGSIPLHTIDEYIDYGFREADTIYGKIGVKVWIHRGGNYGRA